MSCPTESHTLEEFESGSATYSSRESSGLRKRLKEIGIRIYEAVSLGKATKDEAYKARMELEKILGTNITGSAYVDSAWGCKHDCDCQGVSYSQHVCREHTRWGGRSACICDTVKCPNHSDYCECDGYEDPCPQY